MTSPREWQLIGLNTLFCNLQRLHAFDRATALIGGTPEDEARVSALRGWMDAVGARITAALDAQELDAAGQDALQPLAPWLQDEVERYYEMHDPEAPWRDQAAFGAAHVIAADYQTKGERAIADAVGDERESDRLLQHGPRMMALVRQANAAVGMSAEGELTAEVEGYIAEHVRVARGDRSRVTLQVGAIPVTLTGRDPRE